MSISFHLYFPRSLSCHCALLSTGTLSLGWLELGSSTCQARKGHERRSVMLIANYIRPFFLLSFVSSSNGLQPTSDGLNLEAMASNPIANKEGHSGV